MERAKLRSNITGIGGVVWLEKTSAASMLPIGGAGFNRNVRGTPPAPARIRQRLPPGRARRAQEIGDGGRINFWLDLCPRFPDCARSGCARRKHFLAAARFRAGLRLGNRCKGFRSHYVTLCANEQKVSKNEQKGAKKCTTSDTESRSLKKVGPLWGPVTQGKH